MGSQRGRHRLKQLSTHTHSGPPCIRSELSPRPHAPRTTRGQGRAGRKLGRPLGAPIQTSQSLSKLAGTAGCSKPNPSFHRKGNRGPERAKALLKTARRGCSGRLLAPSLGALPCPGSLRQARALEPLLSDRTEGCLSDVVTMLLRRARGQGRGGGGRKWAEGNPTPRPLPTLRAPSWARRRTGSPCPAGLYHQESSLLSCPLGARAASFPESRKDGGGRSPSFG